MPVNRICGRMTNDPDFRRANTHGAPGSIVSGAPRQPTGAPGQRTAMPASIANNTARQAIRRRTTGARAVRRFAGMVCLAASIGALCAAGSPAVAAPRMPGDREEQAHSFAPHVREAARRFDLPDAWLMAVMRTESAGDPHARSPAGAIGLMQVMPATWTDLTARHRLGDDPWDVRANVLAGAAYLREMVERYGDLETALAAYNAGPGRADAWRRGKRALPAETVQYVAKILHLLGREAVAMPSYAAAGPTPPNWQHSPLFAARAGPEPVALLTPTSTVSPPIALAQGAQPSPSMLAAPPAERLFVARSPAGR